MNTSDMGAPREFIGLLVERGAATLLQSDTSKKTSVDDVDEVLARIEELGYWSAESQLEGTGGFGSKLLEVVAKRAGEERFREFVYIPTIDPVPEEIRELVTFLYDLADPPESPWGFVALFRWLLGLR